jgi:hypothetical protein
MSRTDKRHVKSKPMAKPRARKAPRRTASTTETADAKAAKAAKAYFELENPICEVFRMSELVNNAAEIDNSALMLFSVTHLCEMISDLQAKYYGRPLAERWVTP